MFKVLKGYLVCRWVAQLFTWGSAVWCVNVSELAAQLWPQCASKYASAFQIRYYACKHEDKLPALCSKFVKPAGSKAEVSWSPSDESKSANASCRAGTHSFLSAMRSRAQTLLDGQLLWAVPSLRQAHMLWWWRR